VRVRISDIALHGAVQTHLAAELDEARAHFAEAKAVVFAEIADRLVVGDEAAKAATSRRSCDPPPVRVGGSTAPELR
jgi:hypothetical protein